MPDLLINLILSTNIGISTATFHLLIPVYLNDLLGRDNRQKIEGALCTQFAGGCLYQYIMSEYRLLNEHGP